MSSISIRPATRGDLTRLTEIYNYYVINTPITFDIEPKTVESRIPWFEQFGSTGKCRLCVAEENGLVLGYAGTARFWPKPEYKNTVETMIYCCPGSTGKGIGSRLYTALFESIAGEEVERLIAGYTLPNPASAALHKRFGFKLINTFKDFGYKFNRYWDVAWTARPLRLETLQTEIKTNASKRAG
jgi:phosphinothricin acetyltransferase